MRRKGRKGRDAIVEHIIEERLAFAHLASWAGLDETEVRDAINGLRDKPEIRCRWSDLPAGTMARDGHDPSDDVDLAADGTVSWAPPGPEPGRADITVLKPVDIEGLGRMLPPAPVRLSDAEARRPAAAGLGRTNVIGPGEPG